MTALLTGLNTALYITHRLNAYIVYLQILPDSQTRTNFENALIDLYKYVLQFLAKAIGTYEKNMLRRAVDAFWRPEEVRNFEDTCNIVATRAETEASNCDRTLSIRDRDEAKKRKEQLQNVLEELKRLRTIEESIDLLASKIDFARLPSAKGAAFDSYADELDGRCHRDTRVDLLREIKEWAQDPEGKCIFWLSGMAGTGKSTISRTVAQLFANDDQLGASFFFKRGEGERGNVSRFFTTITTQIVRAVPDIIPFVRSTIDEEPEIATKPLKEQFERLLLQPLSQIDQGRTRDSPLVLVVDALDECEGERDIRNILYLLAQMQKLTTVWMRVFLTTRPELPIRLGFKDMSTDAHQDVKLQDLPPDTIEHDISAFLMAKFAEIRSDYNSGCSSPSLLPADWPGHESIQALARMAVPLFIFAATTCRFVGDRWKWNPNGRLTAVLEQRGTRLASPLDQTYLPVLKQLEIGRTDLEIEELGREFREIIGSIVLLADPLPTLPLARLLGISVEDVDGSLHFLHSVLSIPSDPNVPVRILHLSFREFLIDGKKEGKKEFWFWVDEKKTHAMIATKCLELLSTPLCLAENICQLESPGTLRREINPDAIKKYLPADIRYACRYWVHHLEQGRERIYDDDSVHRFLQKHFLHWLEALSLLGNISDSIALINTLRSLVSVRFSHIIWISCLLF